MKPFPIVSTHSLPLGGARRGRKWIGRNAINLIVGWCGRFLFFVVPCQFSFGEWCFLRTNSRLMGRTKKILHFSSLHNRLGEHMQGALDIRRVFQIDLGLLAIYKMT